MQMCTDGQRSSKRDVFNVLHILCAQLNRKGENDMQIMQGDQYNIPFEISDSQGAAILPAQVESVEFSIGNMRKSYPDNAAVRKRRVGGELYGGHSCDRV